VSCSFSSLLCSVVSNSALTTLSGVDSGIFLFDFLLDFGSNFGAVRVWIATAACGECGEQGQGSSISQRLTDHLSVSDWE
jgi:hypothetical protein